jgi:hypothetical protein
MVLYVASDFEKGGVDMASSKGGGLPLYLNQWHRYFYGK